MPPSEHLGKLQLSIMRVLWREGEATVNDVHDALLESHGLAPTTIATMLRKMEVKGVVAHRTEGRRFIYQPAVSEDTVTRSMVADLTERLFDGDPTALVCHLISEHAADRAEIEELRDRIARALREKGSEA
ncbi:MAG: BlaI/MecI/CopY family transcriptional regulator [Myxococcales bacterium]|nr:BlaI/MecI/CopY family transcriptional regulator [Myxococcales bacterium]